VLPIGRLKGVTIDLDGVHTMEDFEVIEIVDGTTPYPTLLGLDWKLYNQAIINLNTRKMTFESGEYRVIAPLDPSEGESFVEEIFFGSGRNKPVAQNHCARRGLCQPNCRWGTQLEKHYILCL
jgi:hypothetical protein